MGRLTSLALALARGLQERGLGLGLSNRQIADALAVTEGTAANYVQRVLQRLGFRRRAEVAAWAVEQGLHKLEPVP